MKGSDNDAMANRKPRWTFHLVGSALCCESEGGVRGVARGPFLLVAVWLAQNSDWLLVQGLLALFQVLVEESLAPSSLSPLQSPV